MATVYEVTLIVGNVPHPVPFGIPRTAEGHRYVQAYFGTARAALAAMQSRAVTKVTANLVTCLASQPAGTIASSAHFLTNPQARGGTRVMDWGDDGSSLRLVGDEIYVLAERILRAYLYGLPEAEAVVNFRS